MSSYPDLPSAAQLPEDSKDVIVGQGLEIAVGFPAVMLSAAKI